MNNEYTRSASHFKNEPGVVISSADTGLLERGESYIKNNPNLAMMMSVAAGLAAGMAISVLLEPEPRKVVGARRLASDLGERFLEAFDNFASSGMQSVRDAVGR